MPVRVGVGRYDHYERTRKPGERLSNDPTSRGDYEVTAAANMDWAVSQRLSRRAAASDQLEGVIDQSLALLPGPDAVEQYL